MSTEPRRVLIVDDEPAARAQLRAVIDAMDTLEIVAEVGDGRVDPQQREPGPAANPVIRKGQKSPAYLRAVPGGKSYELAAGAFSFKTATIKAR